MTTEKLFISIAEMARLYQLNISKIREFEDRGLIKGYRHGKRGEHLYRRSEVRAFIYAGIK